MDGTGGGAHASETSSFMLEATLHPRIRGGKMVALPWFYLHPRDQLDGSNSLSPLDTDSATRQTPLSRHGQIRSDSSDSVKQRLK